MITLEKDREFQLGLTGRVMDRESLHPSGRICSLVRIVQCLSGTYSSLHWPVSSIYDLESIANIRVRVYQVTHVVPNVSTTRELAVCLRRCELTTRFSNI